MARAGRESAAYPEYDVSDTQQAVDDTESHPGPPIGARPLKPLDLDELKSLLSAEISDALGNLGSAVSEQRRQAIAYYYGKSFGNEQVGRSQVILTDVADTIEWIMPALLRMFFGGDTMVRYKPKKQGQEDTAKQASDYINDYFLNQDDGFITGHDWMKTALLEKNGEVKSFFEETVEPQVTRLQQIPELELARVMADTDVEIIEVLEREETVVVDNPETGMPMEMPTFDVSVRRVKTEKKIRTVAIPPEEFLIARRAIRLDEYSSFTAHRVKRTCSDLISMGYNPDLVLSLPSDDMPEFSLERTERLSDDETFPVTTAERADAAAREIWLNDCYLRVDFDGDGFTELRNCLCVGDTSITVLHNDYANFNPFASLCPIPMPHKFFGVSVADQVMDLQLIRSTLLRQMLDNVYLQNNARHAVVEGQVEIDDLLNSLPGGVVRMTAPGMVEPLVTQPLGQGAFQMLEYLEGVRENRTGVTRYNSGQDAGSLNKTATGVTSIMEAANARIETIARIFAETGWKRLFKNLLRLMVESPVKEQVVKLRGEWVSIDPSTWDPDWDVEIEVGMGVGQAAHRMQGLMQILEMQQGFVNAGMGGLIITPDNSYNAAREAQLALGFKNDGYFFTDPAGKPPPPPPPDPQMVKVQADQQAKTEEREIKMKELEVDALRIQQDGDLRRYEAELRVQTERDKIESEERIVEKRLQVEMQKAQIQANTALDVAEEKSKTTNGSGQEAS